MYCHAFSYQSFLAGRLCIWCLKFYYDSETARAVIKYLGLFDFWTLSNICHSRQDAVVCSLVSQTAQSVSKLICFCPGVKRWWVTCMLSCECLGPFFFFFSIWNTRHWESPDIKVHQYWISWTPSTGFQLLWLVPPSRDQTKWLADQLCCCSDYS